MLCVGVGLNSYQNGSTTQSFASNLVNIPVFNTTFDPACTSFLINVISDYSFESCFYRCQNSGKDFNGYSICASISFDSATGECKLWAYQSMKYPCDTSYLCMKNYYAIYTLGVMVYDASLYGLVSGQF